MTMDMTGTGALARRAADVIEALGTAVPSPCVSVCKMDAQRLHCIGCLRTIPEIAGWSRMDDEAKRTVWQAIAWRTQRPLDPEKHP